jgi:hypothetical protein
MTFVRGMISILMKAIVELSATQSKQSRQWHYMLTNLWRAPRHFSCLPIAPITHCFFALLATNNLACCMQRVRRYCLLVLVCNVARFLKFPRYGLVTINCRRNTACFVISWLQVRHFGQKRHVYHLAFDVGAIAAVVSIAFVVPCSRSIPLCSDALQQQWTTHLSNIVGLFFCGWASWFSLLAMRDATRAHHHFTQQVWKVSCVCCGWNFEQIRTYIRGNLGWNRGYPERVSWRKCVV